MQATQDDSILEVRVKPSSSFLNLRHFPEFIFCFVLYVYLFCNEEAMRALSPETKEVYKALGCAKFQLTGERQVKLH